MSYYRTLQMWKANDNINFDFYDAHDLNSARDISLTESIKNQIRFRFDNSKLFMIIVGNDTKWNRKFIPWEIDQALNRNLPIIVVYLNGSRQKDDTKCPTILRDTLAIHIHLKPESCSMHLTTGLLRIMVTSPRVKNGAYHYKEEIYKSLGL